MNEYALFEYYSIIISKLATFFHVSSVALTVYTILFIFPLIFLCMTVTILYQRKRIRLLKRLYEKQKYINLKNTEMKYFQALKRDRQAMYES
ncbi:hypothetical protein [Xanthovirga aplysinae]|uniref:hypothetical protein n=1 Tax=Xanthovirga aplysinae TaxID=2529853 RepID=UPI0012BCBAE5|nr:hypothetical protein [Xanthovirga aplysinae]MTI33503.1 hypothetical protein [Xanthovirga aplysinae]